MNRLELCQKVVEKGGVTGALTSTLNPTVGSEFERVIGWVDDEHRKIQVAQPHWKWMRRHFQLLTVSGTDEYAYDHAGMTDVETAAPISRFSRFYGDQLLFKSYLQSAGVGSEGWVTFYKWDDWRLVYDIGTIAAGPPAGITIMPNRKLKIGPEPDAIYVVSGDYQLSTFNFTANEDEPEFPEAYHDLLWLGAIRRLAAYKAAPELWAEVKAQYGELWRALKQDQMPDFELEEPLA